MRHLIRAGLPVRRRLTSSGKRGLFSRVAGLCVVLASSLAADVVNSGTVSYEHIFVLGQSRSNGAMGVAITNTQPYGNLYWDYTAGLFRPLVEGQIPYYPGSETIGSSFANYLSLASGGQKYVVDHDGKDGTCLYDLNRQNPVTRSGPYAGLFGEMSAVRNALAANGRSSAITAATWQQGECDALNRSNAGASPNAPSLYYLNTLRQLVLDLQSDAASQTGQSRKPLLFLDQISSETAYLSPANLDATAYSVAMQQWQLADGADSDKAVLVGPTYQLSYKDGVHVWEGSTRAEGFYFGKVMKRVLVDHLPWTPLKPRSISLSGTTINAQFWVPAPPLQWGVYQANSPYDPPEHTWSSLQNGQPLQVYRGFEFWDGSPNPPAITSATLTGPDTLRLTLSGPSYGPTPRLRYAYSGLSGQWAGISNSAGQPNVTSSGGNLKDSDSTLDPLGNRMPNWCVRFDAPLPFSANASLPPDLGAGVAVAPPTPAPAPAPAPTPAPAPAPDPAPAPVTGGSSGSWLKGFSFRATPSFVADPAGSLYVLCSDTYPTTRAGVTFGWESGTPACQDENNTSDPRLAGSAYTILRQKAVFRLDLPAGAYQLGLAAGSFRFGQSPYLQVSDQSAPVLTLPQSYVSASTFRDAKGSAWPAASWAGSQQTQTIAVTSGSLRFTLDASQSPSTVTLLNYFYLQSIGAVAASFAPPVPTPAPAPAPAPSGVWNRGFNFRRTPGFVADPAASTYVLCSDAYPTTRDGLTFGWEGNLPLCVDEDPSADPRLAGLAYVYGQKSSIFRVDVPAGSYSASLGAGSARSYQSPYLSLQDGNAAVPSVVVPWALVAPGTYRDLAGGTWPGSSWFSKAGTAPVVVKSGSLKVTIDPKQSPMGVSLINHLSLSAR